jgi:hypothetical protein
MCFLPEFRYQLVLYRNQLLGLGKFSLQRLYSVVQSVVAAAVAVLLHSVHFPSL